MFTRVLRLRQNSRMGSMATSDGIHIWRLHLQEWYSKDKKVSLHSHYLRMDLKPLFHNSCHQQPLSYDIYCVWHFSLWPFSVVKMSTRRGGKERPATRRTRTPESRAKSRAGTRFSETSGGGVQTREEMSRTWSVRLIVNFVAVLASQPHTPFQISAKRCASCDVNDFSVRTNKGLFTTSTFRLRLLQVLYCIVPIVSQM